MAFFSIILPIYNVEKYLARCVESIINEKFRDYEMILVDDGSTDNCHALCDEYAKKYPFIQVVHKENGGLSSARNAGYKLATGEYVFWIDSDDWICEGALERIYNACRDTRPDILKFNFMNNPGGEIIKSELAPGYYDRSDIEDKITPMVLENSAGVILSIWSHVYRNGFIKENGLSFISEREIGSEDYLFSFEAYSCAKSLLVIEDVLYVYDYREGSLSHRKRDKLSDQYKNLQKLMIRYAKENGIYEKYKGSIAYSYINKTFCIRMRNECYFSDTNTIIDGYKKCREILNEKELRDAVKNYPIERVDGVDKRNFLFMKYKMTSVLMFMLIRGLMRQGK